MREREREGREGEERGERERGGRERGGREREGGGREREGEAHKLRDQYYFVHAQINTLALLSFLQHSFLTLRNLIISRLYKIFLYLLSWSLRGQEER